MKDRKFNIPDRVYHCTPESPVGVVIDAQYKLSTNKWEYQVTFGPDSTDLWYMEHELSDHKIYE